MLGKMYKLYIKRLKTSHNNHKLPSQGVVIHKEMPDQAEAYLQHLDPLNPVISYSETSDFFFNPFISALECSIFLHQ